MSRRLPLLYFQKRLKIVAPYMTIEEVVKLAERGKKAGCKEALFTLGKSQNLDIAVEGLLSSKRFKSTRLPY